MEKTIVDGISWRFDLCRAPSELETHTTTTTIVKQNLEIYNIDWIQPLAKLQILIVYYNLSVVFVCCVLTLEFACNILLSLMCF